MQDLASLPEIDKFEWIGAGCARLPIAVDASQVRAEVDALPAEWWGSRGGRGGVHDRAEAIWLRGYAPAERRPEIDEREPFARLPTLRRLVMETIPATPLRCVLARLAAGAVVPAHADSGAYFVRTLRFHVAVITSPAVIMYADERVYHMAPGEVWALNNAAIHGVLNDDSSQPRTHLIVDFVPSGPLRALLDRADRGLGVVMPEITARFEAIYRAGLAQQVAPH
jgi:quercetin dioxygenase-like cupin family protein